MHGRSAMRSGGSSGPGASPSSKVPLTVTAVDVDKLELVVFGHGGIDAPLLDVLAATCALPPYFPAVSLGGRMLRDGGLMGHLPLAVVGETGGQPVIAVDAGPGFDNGREPKPPGGPPLVRAVDESIGILMAQVAEDQVARWRAGAGPDPVCPAAGRAQRDLQRRSRAGVCR